MTELTKRTTMNMEAKATRHAWVAGALVAATAAIVACGPAKPPPRAAEVPIDQFAAPAGPAPVEAPGTATSEPAAAEPPGTPGAAPTPLPTNTAAPSGGGTPGLPVPTLGNHGKPAKALRLAAADCGRLLDRYAYLVALGTGLTAAQAVKAAPGVKAQMQSDASFTAAVSACLEQTSKKQSACALKAATVAAWTTCLE